MRRRAVIGALAIAGGLAAGVLVAQLGWSARAHQPTVLEWMVQVVVLAVAVLLVWHRVFGRP